MFIDVKDKVKIKTENGNYDGIINHIVLQPNQDNETYDTIVIIEQQADSEVEPFGIGAVFSHQIKNIEVIEKGKNNI